MTQQLPAVTFQRLNPAQARELRDTVESIYVQSYTDAITSGDPFDSVEAFMRRFDSYASSATFDMIIAYADGSAVGQTWGWPLAEGARWWSGLLSEPEPDFTREDGTGRSPYLK